MFRQDRRQVGNLGFFKSGVICVDRTAPEIFIDGIGDRTANSGNVKIKVECRDTYYKTGTLQVEIAGKNGGKVPLVNKAEENLQGAEAEYFDIPRQKSYDDVYHMEVHAEDLSGNVKEESLDFSVNRFGSVYDLSDETRKNLQQYYLTQAKDVVFYETNIDYIGQSNVYCRHDGTLQELEKGKDYRVTMQGNKDTWKQYCYTVPAGYFQEEGVYELLLSSKDRADNKSDTGLQEKRVAFVLDWSAPSCVVTGILPQSIYEEKQVTACFAPQDNFGLKSVKIYQDSQLVYEEKERKNNDPIKIILEEKKAWQTLQIFLSDFSGNTFWSEEFPIYVGGKKGEVVQYRKKKASARELTEKQVTVRTLAKTELKKPDGEIQKAGIRGDGFWLLLGGIVVFLVTILACFITGFHRKN